VRIPGWMGRKAPAVERATLAGTIVFVFLTLAVVNGASWWFLRSVRAQLEEQLAARLLSVATLTASALEGEGLADVDDADPESSLYLIEVEELLRRFHDASAEAASGPGIPGAAGVAGARGAAGTRDVVRGGDRGLDARRAPERGVTSITLLSPSGVVLADAEGRLPAGTPSPLLELDRSASAAAAAGFPGTTDLYEQGGFMRKAAYAGVTDARGAVQGLVVVEADAEFFGTVRLAQRRLWITLAASGLAVLVLAALFLRVQRGMTRIESQMRRTETLATMGQMVASLAHEIRNPLGIISGAAERIKEKYGKDGDEIFDYISDEVARLNAVLTAYLDFARSSEAGRETVSVASVAEKALVLLENDLAQRGVEVERDYDAGGRLDVSADPARLQQVFLNLFLNARDAMPQGGRLTVALRRVHGGVDVTVRDTGEGIAPERLGKVFEPFYSSKERGSGLGLAIVEKIVGDHRGRIAVESRPGEGTAFRFTLPSRT